MTTVDHRLVSQFSRLHGPHVSDALDRLGLDGAPQGILPIYPCAKICGPAATLKLVPRRAGRGVQRCSARCAPS
jgi:regulator of RNase E activity RraA